MPLPIFVRQPWSRGSSRWSSPHHPTVSERRERNDDTKIGTKEIRSYLSSVTSWPRLTSSYPRYGQPSSYSRRLPHLSLLSSRRRPAEGVSPKGARSAAHARPAARGEWGEDERRTQGGGNDRGSRDTNGDDDCLGTAVSE